MMSLLAVASLSVVLAWPIPAVSETLDGVSPLMLTPPMKSWVHRVVPRSGSSDYRMRRLVDGLLRPGGLHLRQIVRPTGTATDAFESGQANCVAFAHLVVVLAREVGVPAYFVWTRADADLSEQGTVQLAERHMAAAYGPEGSRAFVDFRGLAWERRAQFQVVSDRSAAAILYSNRGVEAYLNGEVDSALNSLRHAVRLDPNLDDAWLNLGVVLRRAGDPDAAENAYLRALELDPDSADARNNLTYLYHLRSQRRSTDVFQTGK